MKAEQETQALLRQSETLVLAREGEVQSLTEQLSACERRHGEVQARAATTNTQFEAEIACLKATLNDAATMRHAAESARAEAQCSIASQQQEVQRLRDVNRALEATLSQVRKQLAQEEERSSALALTVAELEGSLQGTRQSLAVQQAEFQRMEEQWCQRHCTLQGEAMKLRGDNVAWMEQATAMKDASARERREHEAAVDDLLARHRQDLQERLVEQESEWSARLEAVALTRRADVSSLRLQLLEMEGQMEKQRTELEKERAEGRREAMADLRAQAEAQWAEDRVQREEAAALHQSAHQGAAMDAMQAQMDRLREVMLQEVRIEADVQRREAEIQLLLEMDALRQQRTAEMEEHFAEERRRKEDAWATEWALRGEEARATLAVDMETQRAKALTEWKALRGQQQELLEATKGDIVAAWRVEWDAECAVVRSLWEQGWAAEQEERRQEEERQLLRRRDSWEQRLGALLAELEASAQAAWEQCVTGVRRDRDDALEQWWHQLRTSTQQEMDSLHTWARLQVEDHAKQKERDWECARTRLAEEHERAWAAEVTERREALLVAEEERRANARRAVSKGVEMMWSRIENEWQALQASVLAEWARGLEALWAQAHEWSTHTPDAQRAQRETQQGRRPASEGAAGEERENGAGMVADTSQEALQAELSRLQEELRVAQAEKRAEKARWEEERAVFHQLHGNAIIRMLHEEGDEPPTFAGKVNVGRHKAATAAPMLEPELCQLQDRTNCISEDGGPSGLLGASPKPTSPHNSGSPQPSPLRRLSDSPLLDADARMAEAEAQLAAKEVAITRLRMTMTREQRQALLVQEESLRGALGQMEAADRSWICQGARRIPR
eukprot:GGOE01015252.1.p1 GENE.GGOE01015252.1~~GGOE01015252.1.p1  ORF type:complete len:944 (+),score=266.19 GGOE01015252.1:293-2833(+)